MWTPALTRIALADSEFFEACAPVLARMEGSNTRAVHALDIGVTDVVPDSKRWAFALGKLLYDREYHCISRQSVARSTRTRRFLIYTISRIGR